jgi:hypothetical protein
VYDRAELIAARGFGGEADLVAALDHLKVEARGFAIGQQGITLAPIVASIAAGNRADNSLIAPYGYFRLTVYLQAYVALAFAGRHVFARHTADLKMCVGQRGKRGKYQKKWYVMANAKAKSHYVQHTALLN